jgi:uncharacterized protein (DUF433 family)
MPSDVIADRGRGPEITGTRITVYNLLSSFLDPDVTEADIGRVYDLTAGQVAAARAYVLSNPDTVLAEHLKIEARIAEGNPPEVRAQAEWLALRQAEELVEENGPGQFPTFREWIAERK